MSFQSEELTTFTSIYDYSCLPSINHKLNIYVDIRIWTSTASNVHTHFMFCHYSTADDFPFRNKPLWSREVELIPNVVAFKRRTSISRLIYLQKLSLIYKYTRTILSNTWIYFVSCNHKTTFPFFLRLPAKYNIICIGAPIAMTSWLGKFLKCSTCINVLKYMLKISTVLNLEIF